MNSNLIICLVLLAIIFLLIRLERRVDRLEEMFGDIISGEMLRGFREAMKESMSKPLITEIKPMSQETADKLDAAFKRLKDDIDRVNKTLSPKDKTDVNK